MITSKLLQEAKVFLSAILIASIAFIATFAYEAHGNAETLTVSIAQTVTFITTTDNFGTLTPNSYKIATTTTDVDTNATAWHITLSGDNKGTTTASTTMYFTAGPDYNINITDDLEWIPGAATTSAGNATTITLNTDDFLAFRVMTASGAVPFRADTWWGTSDTSGAGGNLWAGMASTSATNRRIGVVNGYNSGNQLNTVQYYLDVPNSQQEGAYEGPLTYTWVTGF